MNEDIAFVLNGEPVRLTTRPGAFLLYVLRNHFALRGTRFGCGEGDCGACMIWLDGKPQASCQLPMISVAGHDVTTVEGLCRDRLHPVQASLLRHNAGQCGYCLTGIVMSAAALLRDEPGATRERIASALEGHLCRCGTHQRILTAIEEAGAPPDPARRAPAQS